MENTKKSISKIIIQEIIFFIKNSFGTLFSREFISVLIPILILWELLPRTGIFSRNLIPALSDVFIAFINMLFHKNLLFHFITTFGRLLAGVSLAVVIAVPLGVIIGWSEFIRKHLLPFFQTVAPVPPPAWAPLTIIIFGIGFKMQIFLIFLGAFYPILFNTYQGVRETDRRYILSARVFGASELTIIMNVYLKNAAGAIIMSIKTGSAMGLVMLTIAEIYGGRSGIGFLLVEAKEFFQISNMIVCMAILGITGWFLTELLKYIEVKVTHWKSGDEVK